MPEEEDLTFEYLLTRIHTVFPGVTLETGKQVGGRQTRFWVWQFLIEVSFCEHKVAVVDKPGTARVTFKFQPEQKGAPVFTKTTEVNTVAGFQAFLNWVVAYLNGILAAVTQAMEGVPRVEADIFSGHDSR